MDLVFGRRFRLQDHYDEGNTGNGLFAGDDQSGRCKRETAVVFNWKNVYCH